MESVMMGHLGTWPHTAGLVRLIPVLAHFSRDRDREQAENKCDNKSKLWW